MEKPIEEMSALELREAVAREVMGCPKPVIPHDQADGDSLRAGSMLWRGITAEAIAAKVVLKQTSAYKNTVYYEAVFKGWKLLYTISEYRNPDTVAMADTPEVDAWHSMDSTLFISQAEFAAYESSIEAAFAVVEKMREKGYWCEMRNQFTVVETPDCWAGFTRLGTTGWNGVPDNWTQAATIPFAICRAALAAVRASNA